MTRRFAAATIGAALAFTPTASSWADYESAAKIYATRDYEHAYAPMHEAARDGEALAQFTLGAMHDVGQYVAIDKKTAAEWYRQAAQQGLPQAQLRLSQMLFAGEGIAPNRPEAYMWALLAAPRLAAPLKFRGNAQVERARQYLDDPQAARAEAQAAAWQPRLPSLREPATPASYVAKTGTGTFLDPSGLLMTGLHVAWPCRRLLISYGEDVNEASLRSFDVVLDVAVLDTRLRPGATAVFSAPPGVGDAVRVLGYALRETRSRMPIVKEGRVTALADASGNDNFFVTSAEVVRGQSGGPVIGADGRVIGLIRSVVQTAERGSNAVAGERVTAFLARSNIAYRQPTTATRAGQSDDMIALVECWQ